VLDDTILKLQQDKSAKDEKISRLGKAKKRLKKELKKLKTDSNSQLGRERARNVEQNTQIFELEEKLKEFEAELTGCYTKKNILSNHNYHTPLQSEEKGDQQVEV